MISEDSLTEELWIFTHVGAFRFLSRSTWENLYNRIVNRGWDMSCTGEMGWLESHLNPYPLGAFFSAAHAASFARAVKDSLSGEAAQGDALGTHVWEQVAVFFSQGPVLIRSQPPRKTAGTGMMEVVYGYSCLTCGFLYSGSWLFSLTESTLQEIRNSVETMLTHTYCPLCGSKDVVAVTFFLEPLDPEATGDFMSWQPQPGREAQEKS